MESVVALDSGRGNLVGSSATPFPMGIHQMTPPAGELRRELGLFDTVMINAGTVVASAIFIVPGVIAAGFLSSGPSILVWVVGGLVSLSGALCVAELGAAMPEAGGQFVYLRRAWSPMVGFLYGWGAFMVINTASVAAIAVGFATYLSVFVPLSAMGIKLVAIASIIALTTLNVFGLKFGSVTQNVLTSLKILALLSVPVIALFLVQDGARNMMPLWPADGRRAWLAFGPAMVAVLWAYDGWIETTYVGSEIKNPGRNLPLSIILSTLLVIALYLIVNTAYFWILGPDRVAGSELVASDAMTVLLGAGGAVFITLAIVISTLGANNGIVFTAARIPYAMAREGLFFPWAARTHPRFQTPVAALGAQMVIAVAMTLTGSYTQLLTYVVFVSFLFYALSAAGVIRLRFREPDMARPYRAWGYPFTPIVFILFALYLVGDTIVQTPRESAVGAAILLAGVPAYLYWSRQKGQPGRT